MITHKPQLWFSFNKPINPIYDILLQIPLLMKLDLWYMFVNALIHKTQLRYPFFRAIFTHKPNYGILFCKSPFTHKTQLWYTFCKAPFTHKTQLSYPANKLYWQIPIMLPYTWKWNPSLTKTQLWLEFSKAHLLLSQNPIPVSFCFSHLLTQTQLWYPFAKAHLFTSTPNNCFAKPDTPEILLLQTKDWKTRWEWRKIAFMC